MFRGQYEHAVDSKGRTSFPSRFREVLGASGDGQLVMTTGLEACLVAYPLSQWLRFEQRLSQLPQFDESVTLLRRVYVSPAVEVEFDKLGRVLIPQGLRQHAGLKREVLWAGMLEHVELWDKERFEEMQAEVRQDAAKRQAMVQRLAELGL